MRILLTGITLLQLTIIQAQVLLLPQGSTWRYHDQGADLGLLWTLPSYDDSGWSSGSAQLGYGDGDEQTVVSYGPSSSSKFITTYFRQTLFIADPTQYSHLELNLLRDDGAVVYINGAEVWRSNMPNGAINYTTEASGAVAWPNEDDWQNTTVSASWLQAGNNTIAIEIHQDDSGSSDISFDFSLVAQSNLNATVNRGPYLQLATQESVIIRWRTNVSTDSRVRYGVSPVQLNEIEFLPQFTTEHEVKLMGLQANTTYYYAIGTNNVDLVSGPNLFVETLPEEGTIAPYSFLVLGDCGTGYQEQTDVREAVVNQYGTHFDAVLLLGDNAYDSGFDSEYQSNFFNGKYNEIFENTVIWPAPGNHDYNNHLPFSPSPAYFDIFNCPTAGEAGGVPSGTEKYYSYNFGNVHFISLDSYDVPRSASAAMGTWLANDLSNNLQQWVVAYWHHPPYTKGSHDSDNDNFLDGELVEMREEIIPILEQYGVDLILNGHSHSYERSMLIDGHYGDSDSFSNAHIIDAGSGDFPNDCPYHKNTENGDSHTGTVYCVMGNSGKTSSVDSEWPHPVMYSYTADAVGAIILKINDNRLDADFFTSDNEVFDHYTIVKRSTNLFEKEVCVGEQVVLNPSWPQDQPSLWIPGNSLNETFSFQALSNSIVISTDQLGCISDTFTIQVIQSDSCGFLGFEEWDKASFSAIFKGDVLEISTDDQVRTLQLFNASGYLIDRFEVNQSKSKRHYGRLEKGVYFLREETSKKVFRVKK